MTIPLLPPDLLINLLAAAQPALAGGQSGLAGSLCADQRFGEAFRSYAALALEGDEAGAPLKMAALYYTGPEDVRMAIWHLITGADPTGGEFVGEAWAAAA